MNAKLIRLVAVGTLALAFAGCASDGEGEAEGTATEEIRDPNIQTAASAFPEAVLINGFDPQRETETDIMKRCTGTLVAPRAILTAGHCTEGVFRRRVVAPYVDGGQTAAVVSQFTDYVPSSESTPAVTRINFASLDVAVFFIDRPLCLAQYPTLAATGDSFVGGQAVSVGRIKNGVKRPDRDLFLSPAQTLRQHGRPNYYRVDASTNAGRVNVVEGGDSGGPLVVVGPDGQLTKTIAAVTSASGPFDASFARVSVADAERVKQVIADFGRQPGDCGI